MPSYEFTTEVHYIFEASNDQEALEIVEGGNDEVDGYIDHEEYLMLTTINEELNRVIKRYQ